MLSKFYLLASRLLRNHFITSLRYIAACGFCSLFLVNGVCAGVVNPNGLSGKLIVGYQGWFGCPGDYGGNTQWVHWFFNNEPTAENLAVDILPAVGVFKQEDLCATGLYRKDGSPIYLFSSQNPRIVAAHFRWMSRNGIDGAAMQRFVGPLAYPAQKERSDNVIKNAMAAAEAAGRVFYLTYDVSGANPDTVISDIRKDWEYLVNELNITSSPSYLHDNGKPVLEIWGFGFTDRPGTPSEVADLIFDLKNGNEGLQAVELIGGVPTCWRVLDGDSKTDPAWAAVYRSYDVISPWSVGRFLDKAGSDAFLRVRVIPDLKETKSLGIGYMPVVFPGFSWYNLQKGRGNADMAILDQIPRRGGDFLTHQMNNLISVGVTTVYAAMFDEADEGTALFRAVTTKAGLPQGGRMVNLNRGGYSLPENYYMRIAGQATPSFRQNARVAKRLRQ